MRREVLIDYSLDYNLAALRASKFQSSNSLLRRDPKLLFTMTNSHRSKRRVAGC
jgi:hypothetical protein